MEIPWVEQALREAPEVPDPPGGGTHVAHATLIVRQAATETPITPLTVLTAEQKMAFSAMGRGPTCYFWDVVACRKFPSCAVVDSSCRRSAVFSVVPGSHADLMGRLAEHDRTWLQAQQVGFDVTATYACVALPGSLIRLTLHGVWKTLPFSSSSHFYSGCGMLDWRKRGTNGSRGGGPSERGPAPAQIAAQPCEPQPTFNMGSALEELVDMVRAWRIMFWEGQAYDATEERGHFEQAVSTAT